MNFIDGFAMTKILVHAIISLIVLASCGSLRAGIITYSFTGQPGDQVATPATTVDVHVTASSLVRGSGLSIQSTANSMNAASWSLLAIDLTDYYGFSLAPVSGYQMSLTSISFAERRSLTGIREFQLRSSLDGFSTAVAGAIIAVPDNSNVRDQTINLGASFTSLSGLVEFRLYGYSAEGGSGTWRLQNHSTLGGLVVDGTTSPIVAAVPEPSSLFCVAAAFGVLAWHKRHKVVLIS